MVCIPATETRVGLPFAGAVSMSAAATLRGLEVLRREVKLAGLMQQSGQQGGMKDVRVVAVEVGAVGSGEGVEGENKREAASGDLMNDWTASERDTYGRALQVVVGEHGRTAWGRRPTEVSVVTDMLLSIVKRNGGSVWELWDGTWGGALGVACALVERVGEWIGGDRIAVGAGGRCEAFMDNVLYSYLDSWTSPDIRHRFLPPLPHPRHPLEPSPSSPLPSSRDSVRFTTTFAPAYTTAAITPSATTGEALRTSCARALS